MSAAWERALGDELVAAGRQEHMGVALGDVAVAVGVTDVGGGADAASWVSPDAVAWSATPHDEAVLGGDSGPWLPGPAWQLVKTVAVVGLLVWWGWRLPVLRPDRAVEVAWVVLVPLTLLQALVVAVLAVSGLYA